MYLSIKDNNIELNFSKSQKPIIFNSNKNFSKEILFETIKIENGEAKNLSYHQKRVIYSYKKLFKSLPKFDLKDILKNRPKNSLYRAKVLYDRNGLIEYNYYRYKRREIKSIVFVESDIEYNFKFLDRVNIDTIIDNFKEFDEILITKNGYLRDTSIANIALYHTYLKEWHTPINPLFRGVTREKYIKRRRLREKLIHFLNLNEYSKIATLNAMVDFNILKG